MLSRVMAALSEFEIKGMSHITGGGFIENIPRMITREIRCNRRDRYMAGIYLYSKLLKSTEIRAS